MIAADSFQPMPGQMADTIAGEPSDVAAVNCCLCSKPVDDPDGSLRREIEVQATDGDCYVFHYHEACFQKWLGERENVSVSSLKPDHSPAVRR